MAFTGDQTASGVAMLAGAQWVVAANADPSSPFFGHVNTARVGALGHSQGAGGAINATTMSGGLQDARIVVGAGADQPILPAHAGDHPVVTWGNGTFPSLTVVVVIGHGPGAA